MIAGCANAVWRIGEDIQALSRFVGVQRLAFQKLLKKYKKWTSSSDLGQRFRREVLDRPTSFTRKDFEPLLTQWAEVLAAVRAPFEAGTKWQPRSPEGVAGWTGADESNNENPLRSKPIQSDFPQKPPQNAWNSTSNAKDIHSMCENGSNLDFDTALAVIPLGHTASRAVYWVHPDNLIQAHVILLQHTRLRRTSNTTPSSPNTSSQRSSRSGSVTSHWSASTTRADEETGVVVCDDLQQFAKRQNSATISDTENLPGNTAQKATASIRYSSTGEATAVVGTSSESIDKKPRFERAKLKRKAVRQLLRADPTLFSERRQSGQSGVLNDIADKETDTVQNLEKIRAWFSDHREAQPLVQIYMRRARFVGLGNSEAGGLWATVDRDVSMRRCSEEALTNGDDFLTFGEEGKTELEKFPYALLEIRCEGKVTTDLIASLDKSHIVGNDQTQFPPSALTANRQRGFGDFHWKRMPWRPCVNRGACPLRSG